METTLKFDKVILTKELNDKFKQVGKMFEIATILDGSFLLRDAETKVALGVVSFEDFNKYFVRKEDYKVWTSWCPLVGFNGQTDAFYRTNGRRIQVEFLTDKVRAEACCHREDTFNLSFGIRMAYLRAYNKALEKKWAKYKDEMLLINHEIGENETIMKSMIESLEA